MIGNNGYFTTRNLFGFDPWWYTYIGIVGGRGIGKTVSVQSLVIYAALYNKDEFVWVRSNKAALTSALREFPDVVVSSKIKSKLSNKGTKFRINNKIRGHFFALSQAHNIKGSSVNWQNIRYVIFDEFNMEPTEKKHFDPVKAFISVIQTVTRPESRIKAREAGVYVKPITVIFTGNDTQEASPLLEKFSFIPERPGRYVLPGKRLILEFVEDSPEWKRLRKASPLDILRDDDDKQLGESKLDIKIETRGMGELLNPRHLYRVWISLNTVVDVFVHHEGIWVTRQFDSRTILRMHGYRSYVINPQHLRHGRLYNNEIIDNLKSWLWVGRTTFESQMTGRLYIDAVSKRG